VHFFSPVDKMMLVEIIMGEKTGDPALAVALDYVRAIRKTPIVVNDSRGFYTSRVVGTYIREGHLMLTEGVPAAMVENLGKQAGMPVGPALAQRRGRGRSRLEDPEGDGSRPRREGDRHAAEGAARRDGREARPLRAQERQGLLRLSAERPKRLWPGLAELQKDKLDPDTIDKDELKARCSRSRRSKPRAASRKACSPTCARPTSARSSASAMRRIRAARCPTST
jgi:3-hydroxyacyl-CoA dehydrogenase/enoyl-CoA hydratase/3-hydroxybutyryl-CoA epimerase